MTERKALVEVELKAEKEGAFRCTFATLNVVDKDGDVTVPGAFQKAPVRVSQFGHNWGAYIIGDGTIAADDKKAWADAEFYLETSNGLDTYRSVKRASAAGLQQWSYGFDVVKFSLGKFENQDVRFLEALEVHEVSPVMLGAGVGTGTDLIKSLTLADQSLTARAAVDGLVVRYAALAAEVRKEGRAISAARIARIREVIANARGSATAIAAAAEELEKMLADAGADDPAKAALHQLRAEFIATTSRLAY